MAETKDRVPLVAIVGDGNVQPPDRRLDLAFACGQAVIELGYRLVTGGHSGVMRAASAGARNASNYSPGCILGILPGFDPAEANEYVDVAIPTGLDVGRNVLVANSDALIAIGGGAGTLSEIALAWQLHRLIVALRVPGWSGELADRRIDARVRYPGIPDDRVFGADTPQEAMDLIRRRLPDYVRRHKGVARKLVQGANESLDR